MAVLLTYNIDSEKRRSLTLSQKDFNLKQVYDLMS